jgi:hypothetical protein
MWQIEPVLQVERGLTGLTVLYPMITLGPRLSRESAAIETMNVKAVQSFPLKIMVAQVQES